MKNLSASNRTYLETTFIFKSAIDKEGNKKKKNIKQELLHLHQHPSRLDTGSNATLLTQGIARKLNLKGITRR